MKRIKSILLLLFLGIIINSCSKEKIPERPMSQNDIWACYNNSEWNKLKIREKLIGSWKWIYTECFWFPENAKNTENENVQIDFLSDSTLNVIVDGKRMSSTKWTVITEDGKFYGMKLDSHVTQLLYGRIFICDELVEFNDSYIDGCDNYFKKIQ